MLSLDRALTPLPLPARQAFVNNFSSSFRWWDHLLGTDSRYRAYRSRIDAAKDADLRKKVQRVEDAKAEAEGVRLAKETIARAR